MDMEIYDLIIIGGGPAGAAAGVYAARKKLKTILIVKEFGGQSVVSEEIQNWIGTPSISGAKLASDLKKHVEAYASDILTIHEGEEVSSVNKERDVVTVNTDKGTYNTKALLIATGSGHRKLEVLGADRLEHKGLTYCASCDGPLFSDMDVAVIGGGNAGFETSAQLLAYTKSVTLINRSKEFRADPITVEKVLEHPKMRAVRDTELLEIKGDKMVSGLTYKDNATGETVELSVQGIFVEVGQIPNTSFVFGKDIVELTSHGQIIIDPRTQKTSTPGIWAAGDCTDVLYHQNNIAAGDAVRALEDIYKTLKTQ